MFVMKMVKINYITAYFILYYGLFNFICAYLFYLDHLELKIKYFDNSKLKSTILDSGYNKPCCNGSVLQLLVHHYSIFFTIV